LFDSLKRNIKRFKGGEGSKFYMTCINSMRTVRSGTRRIYLQVIHVDAKTLKRITGVTDTLTLDGKDLKMLCSFRGVSSYYSLNNGNGSLLSVKKGYIDARSMNLGIQDGKCLRITVMMSMGSAAKVAKE
jgi:hypothetical protein